jgi:hypothetical protein
LPANSFFSLHFITPLPPNHHGLLIFFLPLLVQSHTLQHTLPTNLPSPLLLPLISFPTLMPPGIPLIPTTPSAHPSTHTYLPNGPPKCSPSTSPLLSHNTSPDPSLVSPPMHFNPALTFFPLLIYLSPLPPTLSIHPFLLLALLLSSSPPFLPLILRSDLT